MRIHRDFKILCIRLPISCDMSGKNDIKRVNDTWQPEQDAEDQIDPEILLDPLYQIHSQRGQYNREKYEQQFVNLGHRIPPLLDWETCNRTG